MIKYKNLLKVLLVNFFFIIIILIVFEVISGNLIFKKKLKCSYILCNADYKYMTDLYTEKKIEINYKKDKYGFRGRKENTKVINFLTVGGSTTDERYLNLSDTWSEQLEDLLDAKFKNIDVVNAGIDGQSSFGHIWNFDQWFNKLDSLEIKNIIFYIGINEKEYPGRHDLNIDEVNYPKKILYILKYNDGIANKLYEFLFHKYNPIDQMNVAHSKTRKNDFFEINSSYDFNADYLSKNIKKLIDQSKKINANPIFVTQKTARWKIIDQKIFSISKKINYYSREKKISEIIIKECNLQKLVCIDGFNKLELNQKDTYDLVHTKPEGSKKIAKFIFNNLKDLNFN